MNEDIDAAYAASISSIEQHESGMLPWMETLLLWLFKKLDKHE